MKPNRHRYQVFRTIIVGTHDREVEETPEQRRQRGICLNCDKPTCRRGWCEKIGNNEHKSGRTKKC